MQIEPRILKGFRDMLPDQESQRLQLVATLTRAFESYGFVPIDTPILEYTEVLLGKGGGETDKQIYRFDDHGGRDVAMRFDLTVPFARYLAQHRNELYTPFRRYHVSKVFRGENTQRGRYREFMQCDVDIVGTQSVSADIEIVSVIGSSFDALGVPGVTIHLSHRGLFNRLLSRLGVGERSVAVLRAVDKLRKVGPEKVTELIAGEVGSENARAIVEFITARGESITVVEELESLTGGRSPESERLRQIVTTLAAIESAPALVVDPSITRGLDYYTGVVFETFLSGQENLGSVCSGGRYDDLVSLYSKEAMPGVGASVGLDRLIAALEESGALPRPQPASTVLITMQDDALLPHYHKLAATLRSRGIACEVFPESRKLGQQFAFAEKKRIPWALICGENERERGTVNLRLLGERTTYDDLSLDQACTHLGSEARSS